jgi:hypothetical protein
VISGREGFPFSTCRASIDDMARTINPHKRAAEERFLHKVDIAVPVDGLGRRLKLMHEWCHDNIGAGDWEEHGHSAKPLGEAPTQYARFLLHARSRRRGVPQAVG